MRKGRRLPDGARRPLRRSVDERVPSQQEEMMSAKTAPARLQKPQESPLDRIARAHRSEIDGPAMRTARGE
jgi:hypothetical protein